eukprot:COSAG01_NODE_3133_length_6533_cov_117.587842_5_plen_79_part_00
MTPAIARVKMRRLGKEKKGLDELDNLPCRPEAAAFCRCDEGRLDVFKFILTGPTDTPYAFGLFEFHMVSETSVCSPSD